MSRPSFSAVTTEGGLLPQDLLSRIQGGDPQLPGTEPETYHLAPHERIGEAVNRTWSRLLAAWRSFQDALAKEAEGSMATGVTRDRWLLPLFQELGYGRLPRGTALTVDGKSYAVSHSWHYSPIHLLGCRVDLDRRQKGVAGASSSSPHGLVQDFLNRSEDHLWGFLSNGYRLRLLRDHHSLTRQAYVEFDLQAIMDGDQYSEFLLLWLVCHQSRVEAENPDDCWLETWVNKSREEGVRALDKLRNGVEKAIEAFGTGFLAHKANARLRQAFESRELDKQDYYRQLLRLVYRLIFLFVAEERGALLDPNASEAARWRYGDFYSTRRVRELADKKRGGPHGDLWRGLALVMGKLHDGEPALGLPALGSWLWGAAACSWLMASECGNEFVLSAFRHLSHIEEGQARYSVNWRNVGADELGSIYEGLLELHPRMNKEAATFCLDTAAGHERKTTGSYYTPTALVDCLLDAALDPLLDEACAQDDPEESILALAVCDPACGSGHFLVAAARRIAKRLAGVTSGDDAPSPRDVQAALRDVAGRCIYGVDVNPMAVELCKVSLWMESIEPGKPLSFLDSHIQCGNALVGTTPELMAEGLPDVAWTALRGEDKARAQRLKRQNQDWRQGMLFEPKPVDLGEAVVDAAKAVEAAGDETSEAVARKEELWRAASESEAAKHARLVADLWCAAFVWPKETADDEKYAPVRRLWEALKVKPGALPEATAATLANLKSRFGFFHWHLGFPLIVERGGFDLILGNPPWDTLSPDQREFFGQYRAGMRSLSPADQKDAVDKLLQDPAIANAWERHQLELFGLVHFLKKSGRYKLYAPGNLGKGDFNVYRMFAELALKGLRTGGFMAQVLPGGIYGGANASAIRHFVLDQCELRQIWGLINTKRGWFAEVDIDRFASVAVRRGGRTTSFRVQFGLDQPADLAGEPVTFDADFIRENFPGTYAIPDVRSAADLTVAKKMADAYPAFGDREAGPPIRHYQAELHMGNDRGLFTDDPRGLPVYEGRMISHFDHRAKTYVSGHGNSAVWQARSFGDPEKSVVPQWRVLAENVPDKLGDRCDRYRIGFGDVANPRNERSVTATLIPPHSICGHTVPTIVFEGDPSWHYLAWLAVANSFVMDCFARRKLSSPHLTYSILDSLPFPRPRRDEPWVREAAPLALRLVCTAPEMREFWNQMAEFGLCKPVPDGTIPPDALLDEVGREDARAELDAIVANDVYRLTRTELSDVLETFPVVKKRDIKKHGCYRTKELILQKFDARTQEAGPGGPSPHR